MIQYRLFWLAVGAVAICVPTNFTLAIVFARRGDGRESRHHLIMGVIGAAVLVLLWAGVLSAPRPEGSRSPRSSDRSSGAAATSPGWLSGSQGRGETVERCEPTVLGSPTQLDGARLLGPPPLPLAAGAPPVGAGDGLAAGLPPPAANRASLSDRPDGSETGAGPAAHPPPIPAPPVRLPDGQARLPTIGELRPLYDALYAVESSSGADLADGDGGAARGPYQLHRGYWLDSGLEHLLPYEHYCRNKMVCELVIYGYWLRHCPGALAARDYQTLARYQKGPDGSRTAEAEFYWCRVQATLLIER